MKSIIRFFYHQHLFGNLLTVLIFVAGLYSIYSIRKDMFPQVNFDITVITSIYPGATPDQIEKLVLNPIEEVLKEVDGIKKVQSQALDNRAVLTVVLDPDARDPKKTHEDIQRVVDQVEDYPKEAEKPIVMSINSAQSPIIEVSLTSDTLPELELRDIALNVSNELSNTDGVAKVSKDGWRKKEIQILVDQNKLSKNDVSLTQMNQSLAFQNFQMPAGDLVLPSGEEISIKTDGEFKSLKEIENFYIRRNFEGLGVQIQDLANVRLSLEKPSLLYRTNGQSAFKLTIIKKENADALKTVEAVRKKMDQLSKKFPKDVEYYFINDFTFYLKSRLSTLSGNMVLGIVLVCLILALFLPFRVAIVVALGIPISMLSGIMLIQHLGFSLNLVSLIGLIIVSGMLVDDAIVVTENIYRRLELGDNSETAIIEGASEMVAPVFASVLTTVAAFSPMLFMSGIFGKFIFEIPVMVILPLVFSLFEAFLIAPGHILTIVGSSVLKKSTLDLKENSKKAHWYDGVLVKYRNIIYWTLDNRYKTFGAFIGLLILTGVATTQMKFILFPPEGIYTFFVRVDAEPGTPLVQTNELLKKIEPEIAQLSAEELVDYTTMVGIQQEDPSDPFTKRGTHYAQIIVNLTPEEKRKRSVEEIVKNLKETIRKPQRVEKINFSIAQGGPPQGKPVSINIYGEDFVELKKIGTEIKNIMKGISGIIDVEDSEVIGKKEVKVIPQNKQLAELGVSGQELGATLRATFAGLVPTTQRNLNEEIDIRIQIKPSLVDEKTQLKNIKVGNFQGDLVPLTKLALFQEGDSQSIIRHEKYKRIFNVSAQLDLEKLTATSAAKILEDRLKPLQEKYPQYEISFAGENEDTEESMKSLVKSFGVAAVLIFFILILTFKSFLQPLLVLIALPLGFMGVVFALLVHGRPLSFMAMLGIIALAGVIVNNSIVYIDYFNIKRKEDISLKQALVDAASTRLRPIILTSLTTVLGLLPTAYGIGGSDGFVMGLALALGWGLMIGSTLTVLVFPSILHIVEDVQNVLFRKLRRKTV